MKMKTLIAALLATCLLQHSALTQTNAVAADQTAAVAPTSSTTPDVSQPVVDTNATAAVSATAPESVTTNSPGATTNETAEAGGTNATPAVAVIPLIQFQDVPITTAIDALARQAGINYLLDPKIGYGQPEANGQIKAEPNLSIRWENIPAMNALQALLDNYGLQLVADPHTRIFRVTIKDPTAPPPLLTHVVQLKYASTTNMMEAIQGSLTDKRSRVIPDTRTSQLIVVATDPEQTAVDTLVAQLDTPTKQVLIETRLVEISSNPQSKKGINWAGTLSAQNIAFGNNTLQQSIPATTAPGVTGTGTIPATTPASGPSGLLSSTLANSLGNAGSGLVGSIASKGFFGTTAFLNADGASAVLSFLNSSVDAQVMSTPRVVTLDNEPATISVQTTYPILQTTAGTQGSPGGSTISYSNVGTVLIVTPRISAGNTIRLNVLPTVENFLGYQTLTAQGGVSQAPQFEVRAMQTQVLIPNANTLVMGGLVNDNPVTTSTKVPVLGDIPFLGAAFRSEDKVAQKNNLLVFITPTILQDTDFHPTTTDFLNAQPQTLKSDLNPNSIWDSARPHNWANPQNTDPTQPLIDQKATM